MRSATSLLSADAIPPGARRFLTRRLAELGGLALIFAVILIGLALATWSTRDPSVNHATAGPVRNMLGARGAVLADLLTQVFGLASLAVLAPLGLLGWRLMVDHRLDRLRWRILLWIFGAVCAAGVASLLPAPDRWPLPTGLGGMIGDAIMSLPRRFSPSPLIGLCAALALGCAALLSLAAACSVNRGFVRLHDAATAGDLPKPAGDADAAASGVALSAVAGTVADTYRICRENAEQLTALQDWAIENGGAE